MSYTIVGRNKTDLKIQKIEAMKIDGVFFLMFSPLELFSSDNQQLRMHIQQPQ